MKKNLLFIFTIIFIHFGSPLSAQQNIFSKVYYDGISTVGNAVVEAFDGGYVIAGSNNYAGLIMKIDTAGNQQWKTQIGGQNDLIFNSVARTYDSGYVATGRLLNIANGKHNLSCIKLNINGDTVWTKMYTNINDSEGFSVQQCSDHGYILSGAVYNNAAPYSFMLVIKTDSAGTLQWQKTLTPGTSDNIGYSVKETADSGFIVAGTLINSSPAESVAYIVKLSNNGSLAWSKKYNTVNGNLPSANDLVCLPDGYMVLLSLGYSPALMRINLNGNPQWTKTYPSFGSPGCYNCAPPKFSRTADEGYILCSGMDLIRTDSTGTIIWQDFISMYPIHTIETIDHGYFVLGNGPVYGIYPMETYAPQIGVVKTDSLGNGFLCAYNSGPSESSDSVFAVVVNPPAVSGGSSSNIYPVVTNPSLADYSGCVSFLGSSAENESEDAVSIYPNPFNDKLEITFSTPTNQGEIILTDVLGKILIKKTLSPLTENYSLSRNNLSAGLYILQIRNNKQVISKRVIIN